MTKTFCFLLFICMGFKSQGQHYPPGKVFRITSSRNMFPDSLRNVQPRVYDDKTYTAAEHYNDSTVFIFVPDYYDKTKATNFVFWFHGWNNNIDSALSQFQLLEQFYAAHQNAIFVFPEGPKNAPDSYCGKWEQKRAFTSFYINDIWMFLSNEKILVGGYGPDATITLAGHSGAYRVIGKIDQGNDHLVAEIILFDALYGEIDGFVDFALRIHRQLSSKAPKKFINIYTDNGGTQQNSLDFLKTLDSLHIPYLHKEEDELVSGDLKNNRIIFLHSKKTHNEVITNNRNFERFLKKEAY
ncbi:MAG: hypothetical protein ABIX01_09045 [Chitinophagaceae bacterium]